MAEEQALGTPSNRDPCAKHCLDSQPPINPAVVKLTVSSAAACSVSALSSSSSSSSSAVYPPAITPTTATNRCVACRKRVGLTGFRCRCGSTYCGVHRYPENHGCEFNYRAAGRDQIRRQNPVVIAEKLQKI